MHNLSAIFVKILDICKQFGNELVDARGNIPRPGSKPRFSDLEVTALNLTMESLGIDSESFFFALLQGYREEIPNLISRRQFIDRRKFCYNLCASIRKRIGDPTFIPFAKARKRIKTTFSQIDDQFMMIRNYAKDVRGLFTRVLGKITAFTVLQYLNKVNNRPIGRVKYALL